MISKEIIIIACETSGDIIGSRIISRCNKINSSIIFKGIGGVHMRSQGLISLWNIKYLNIFGYIDAIKKMPLLFYIYRNILNTLTRNPPRLFIGIDAPDFNLRLSYELKKIGVPTIHFAGPSIWGWRYKNIKKISKSISHMFILFPFELEIYKYLGISVTYIGHPLSKEVNNKNKIKLKLDIKNKNIVISILPGSRYSEIKKISPVFLQAAQKLVSLEPSITCVISITNIKNKFIFENILSKYPVPGLICVYKKVNRFSKNLSKPISWFAIENSSIVILKSGTSSLESTLFNKPMVISYHLSNFMIRLVEIKSKQLRPYIPWIGLPNILYHKFLSPEILQNKLRSNILADSIWNVITNKKRLFIIKNKFCRIHNSILRNTSFLSINKIIKIAKL